MMGNKLIDESLPLYEIIRNKDGNPVLKDGKIQRNDGTPLMPAEENPWYKLATVAGEDIRAATDYNPNARYWNRYFYDIMPQDVRDEISKLLTDKQRELFKPLNPHDKDKISSRFKLNFSNIEGATHGSTYGFDFKELYFSRHFDFSDFIIYHMIDFNDSFFNAIKFNNTLFFRDVNFSNVKFDGHSCFNKTVFNGNTLFKEATLTNICFKETAFNGLVDFTNTATTNITYHMGKIGNVHNAQIVFKGVDFKDKALFDNITFSIPLRFIKSEPCEFCDSTCKKENKKEKYTEFHGPAYFRNTTFKERIMFENVTFKSDTSFEYSSFEYIAKFNETTFHNQINFNNTTFKDTTYFTNSIFEKYVPSFFNTQLHQETYFTVEHNFWDYWKNKFKKYHSMEISSQKWPTPPMEIEISKDTKEVTAKNRLAYGRLRQIMNGWQRPREELFFYRQEMYCEAALEAIYYKRFSWTFGVLSDYGFSVWRPLALIIAFWLLGWLLVSIPYLWITPSPQAQISRITTFPLKGTAAEQFFDLSPALIAHMPQNSPPTSCTFTIDDGIVISFTMMMPYFGSSDSLYPNLNKCMGTLLKKWVVLQRVCGAIFLFLLGLGLRNRFRLK